MDKKIREFYIQSIFNHKIKTLPVKLSYEIIQEISKALFLNLVKDLKNELESTKKEKCIDYAYNLLLNRTYEDYSSEENTIYGQLQSILGIKTEPAPDKWDRTYNVDFIIKVKDKFIGLQLKPISSSQSLNQYQQIEMKELNHQMFEKNFGGKVIIVYYLKFTSGKKMIYNVDVIDEIKNEVERLMEL